MIMKEKTRQKVFFCSSNEQMLVTVFKKKKLHGVYWPVSSKGSGSKHFWAFLIP